jgi:pimeloyl-ACP methyl ester carboxylesterase
MSKFEAAIGPAKRVQLPSGPVEYHERGEGRPLLFVHGINLHAGFWRKVVPELSRDFRCIAPTWPLGGHRLAQSSDADLTPPGIADVVADFIAELDLDDVVVVGNDTGGAFAQILVTRRPERIGALVLTPCDALDDFLPPQFKFLEYAARIPGAAWQTGHVTRLAAFRRSRLGFGRLTKHGIPDDVSDSYLAPIRASREVRRDYTKILRGISSRHTLEAAERLRDFDRPTLLAWAPEDPVFKIRLAEELARRLPKATIERIEDSYCYVPEDQPDRLVEAMRAFLGAERAGTDPAGEPESATA